MRRRTLLGGIGSAVILAPIAGCRPWACRNPAVEDVTAHQRATIAAMAATFLPGTAGSPGAAEVEAVDVILDPSLPVRGYVAEVVADLDDWCFVRHGGRAFTALPPAKRERALEERMGLHGRLIRSWYLPVYEGVLALTKLAFFGGLRRAAGTTYVGFPGPSAGYAAHSAAGIHVGDGAGVVVGGAGIVSAALVTALVAGVDAAHAGLRLTAPDGKVHAVAAFGLPAPLAADRAPVPGARGAVAAGTWQLGAAAGELTAWWLDLRTDLDDAAVTTTGGGGAR